MIERQQEVIIEDMRKIKLPRLKDYQQVGYDYLYNCPNTGKTLVVKAKRQCGKSWLANSILLHYSSLGKTNVVVEPTIAQARRVFKQLTKALSRSGIIESANASTLELTFRNGGEILFKSAGSEDGLRGFTVTGVLIIDEAAFIEDEIIDILMPLVDANNANIVFISTPLFTSGRFYEEYISEANNKLVLNWNNYDTSEFLSAEKLEIYRNKISPNKFKSEYLGQFITENGLLFSNIQSCIGEPQKTETIYLGIDFATGSGTDYTAISAINQDGEQVFIKRVKDITPTQQVDWLVNIIKDCKEHYNIAKVLAEQNSIGKVYNDLLKKQLKPLDVHLTDWTTSNSSKKKLVDTLQLAFDNNRIKILNNEKQLDELRKFQANVNIKTNLTTYGAATGNDDQVMALMLSYYAFRGSLGSYNISIV